MARTVLEMLRVLVWVMDLVNAADLGLNADARLRDPVSERRTVMDLENASILDCGLIL